MVYKKIVTQKDLEEAKERLREFTFSKLPRNKPETLINRFIKTLRSTFRRSRVPN